MDIWRFQRLLSVRLIQWALASIGIGALLSLGTKFWRGVGSQFVGWGVVNIAIAYFGGRMADQRIQTLPDPYAKDVLRKEGVNLQRLLWINALLDLFYMRGGQWLTGKGGAFRRGMGVGIFLQGLALFVFDLLHATDTPVEQD
ncbi:hypothetical protein [Candidatus Flexifilum breve]|uniref:DUF6992 family protein n=1 Tax=Candidatus Flexifilum breve TaxID=3140694 RepID=UPI0031CCBDB8